MFKAVARRFSSAAAGPLRLAMIPGDGAGLEQVKAVQVVLAAVSDDAFEFTSIAAGYEAFERTGATISTDGLNELRKCDGAVFGAVASPRSGEDLEYKSPLMAIRKELGLFANMRPITGPGFDFVVLRENTEDLLQANEVLVDSNTAEARRIVTREASERIGRVAFQLAQRRFKARKETGDVQAMLQRARGDMSGRADVRPPHVTVVHKATLLKISDGLFRSSVMGLAGEFSDVQVADKVADLAMYDVIRKPEELDVVVAGNLYGDLLQDAACALAPDMSLVPTANFGDSLMLVHGASVATDSANPVGHILASSMLMDHLGKPMLARAIEFGVHSALTEGKINPEDARFVTKVIDEARFFLYSKGTGGARS